MTGEPYDTDRVLTVPNVLSALRLVGVPVFWWLLLGRQADAAAVAVLAASGVTDFVDGWFARRFHQRSRLGQQLDPVVDRFCIVSAILALAIRDIVPWWFVAVLIARDLTIAGLVPVLRTRGFGSLPVHLHGKAATFAILFALPLVLLGVQELPTAEAFRAVGWACALWGAILYWWAGVLYIRQTAEVLHRFPRIRARQGEPRTH